MSLRSRLVMKIMPSSTSLPQARFSSTTAMSAGTGSFASTSLLRATGAAGNGGGDANFNSTYKPVEWHKDSEDVTNEGDLPSAARLINKDLPSAEEASKICLLYTSDAADEEDSVDLGGRRIIKKKKKRRNEECNEGSDSE
eukprot:TRINITY_DN61494_c0_g1_i2.p1 TRINITY_DN61494_c0_g1~~TRINITY_DN61494_c0_g1_i2.p1  ORF type:complete len:141 (-),score=46.81 TRINITY_DN61494_c0_g1_i2:9-431(-)